MGGRPRRPPNREGESGTERWCTRCRDWWPLDSFAVDNARPDGHDNRCRACRADTRKRKAPALERTSAPRLEEPARENWVVWARWPITRDGTELDTGWSVMSWLLWSEADAKREVERLQVATLGCPEFRIVRYKAAKP